LARTALSVVPVASKKTRKGETPAPRAVVTFKASGPLVFEQEASVGAELETDTVVLCVAEPPLPLQVTV
jgi:hypothetical protein